MTWLLRWWKKKCQSAPSNVYFHAFYNNPFFIPFECIQRKLITFNVNRVQFHSHAYNQLTPVHRGMFNDLNLSHLLWKIAPFLTMFYLVLKLFLKFCQNVFILLLLDFSWQYQLQRLSDISFPKTLTSVWNKYHKEFFFTILKDGIEKRILNIWINSLQKL